MVTKYIINQSNKYLKYIPFESIKLFDVTLRDGLQTANPLEWSTNKKKILFNSIVKHYKPSAIEIGSIVSPKILEIMQDTVPLHNYAANIPSSPPLYTVLASTKRINTALDANIQHFSFLSSASNTFQTRNMKQTINESVNDILKTVDTYTTERNKIKIYISCIHTCPYEGKIPVIRIAELISIYQTAIPRAEICLSDTCGLIQLTDFKRLISILKYYNINIDNISLHLHHDPHSPDDIKQKLQIIRYATINKILKFDVSALHNMGGCSVTMSGQQLKPNITYNFFNQLYVTPDSIRLP